MLDPSLPYRLNPQVALRDESFGALAYHYGSRRLTFLRDRHLVEVVRGLEGHDSLSAALEASGAPGGRHGALLQALTSLADSEVIGAR